jgi:hypothetical protein
MRVACSLYKGRKHVIVFNVWCAAYANTGAWKASKRH